MYILEKEVVVSRWICKRYSQRNLANDDGFICAGRFAAFRCVSTCVTITYRKSKIRVC